MLVDFAEFERNLIGERSVSPAKLGGLHDVPNQILSPLRLRAMPPNVCCGPCTREWNLELYPGIQGAFPW